MKVLQQLMCSLCAHTFLILTWGLSCRLWGCMWSWLGCHLFTPWIWLWLSTGTYLAAGITGCREPAAQNLPAWDRLGQEVPWHTSPALTLGAAEGRKSAPLAPLFCAWKFSCTRLVRLGRRGWAFCSSAIIIWLENCCLHGWVCFKRGTAVQSGLHAVGLSLHMGRGRAEHVFFSSRWQSPKGNLVFGSPGREAAVLWIHRTLSKITEHFWP